MARYVAWDEIKQDLNNNWTVTEILGFHSYSGQRRYRSFENSRHRLTSSIHAKSEMSQEQIKMTGVPSSWFQILIKHDEDLIWVIQYGSAKDIFSHTI